MNREELLQQAKPILFNTEMVRAILEGRKTVTRRVIKPKSKKARGISINTRRTDGVVVGVYECDEGGRDFDNALKPPFKKGDYLYVRETWSERTGGYLYKAWTGPFPQPGKSSIMRWYPSIHMPKEAARLFLKVKDVRVERLQDITEEQAKAEGISRLFDYMSDKDYEDWMKQLGQSEKTKSDWDYKNYLWHGDYGTTGQGNKKTDNWDYQYSAYDSAVDSFSSLWNTTVELKDWDTYGWVANPWVWVIEFERVEV